MEISASLIFCLDKYIDKYDYVMHKVETCIEIRMDNLAGYRLPNAPFAPA